MSDEDRTAHCTCCRHRDLSAEEMRTAAFVLGMLGSFVLMIGYLGGLYFGRLS